jgi:C1A family cysteine protease
LPPSAAIDLRVAGWPVRDQGGRGTCISFATTACVEHDDGTRPTPDLSEQFLYWAIKTHTADPHPNGVGTYLQYARDALGSDGICTEALWSYNGTQTQVESQGGGGNPTAGAVADAATRLKAGLTYQGFQGAGGAAAVLAGLQAGSPVAITIPVFSDPAVPNVDNWSTSVALLYGRVLNPPSTASVSAGHAVCILGFAPDASEPNGGCFIFRNSWNTSWASSAPAPGRSYAPERGYGDISATYIETYLWELLHF